MLGTDTTIDQTLLYQRLPGASATAFALPGRDDQPPAMVP